MQGPPPTLLVITLSNIGDAVMSTPVLEFLHRTYPHARLDIVTDRRSGELFARCPYRREIIYRDKGAGVRGTLGLVRRLRRTRYDLVVDLRTDGLAWLLRARRRMTRLGARPRGPHAVERHMGVLAGQWPAAEIPPPRVWLDETLRREAGQRLASLPGRRWLAIGAGARWPPKVWPAHRFGELLARLRDRFDAVLLLGDRDDRHYSAEAAVDAPLPLLDLTGKTALLQAAAALEPVAAFVGNDSGLGHMAAALGVPTLTVFGPGDPHRYHPWNPRGTWLRSPTGRLPDLPAAAVADGLLRLLADAAEAQGCIESQSGATQIHPRR